MNWFDKQTWRENIASTFLCFISGSIGMFLTALFFMTIFWLLQVFISILASFILSFIAIFLWNFVLGKIDFSEAIKTSYHTSFVSII